MSNWERPRFPSCAVYEDEQLLIGRDEEVTGVESAAFGEDVPNFRWEPDGSRMSENASACQVNFGQENEDMINNLQNDPFNYTEQSVDNPLAVVDRKRRKSKRKRIFQKFWFPKEDDEAEDRLPKPDDYGLQTPPAKCKKGKSEDNLLFAGLNAWLLGSDGENVGSCRLQKNFEDGMKACLYAPKRPPPILDFAMVLTAFIAAVILAYYSVA